MKNQEKQLLEAAKENNAELIGKLVKEGADINAVDEEGSAALHYAVEKGNWEVTDKLVNLQAKLDIKNKWGDTPLLGLIGLEYYDKDEIFKIVKLFLEKGIDSSVRSKFGNTILHFAASNNDLNLLKLLFEYGGDLNSVNNGDYSVLHSAASGTFDKLEEGEDEEEAWKTISWLLEKGVDTEVKTQAQTSVYDIWKGNWDYAERYSELLRKSGK